MNTSKIFTRMIVMVFVFTHFNYTPAFAKSPNNAEIIKRVENLNSIIDLRVTDEVTDQILTLVEKRRQDSEIILGRTSLYFPLIENAIREKNLPDELKYIAVIESSLLPTVESHKGAAGLWQFMKGTAKMYGLTIDKHIDERKDVTKSTEIALDYLKVLYDIYGNWTIALAAYNCGSGNMNKAIKKSGGSSDYWTIQQFLPKETQKYIPRFIAAAYLMNYYYVHELVPSEPDDNLKFVATVKVTEEVDLMDISKEFDIDINIINTLNAMYTKNVIPISKDKAYYLRLPEQKMYSYIEKYNSFDNLQYQPTYLTSIESRTSDTENREVVVVKYLATLFKRSHAIRDNFKNYNVPKSISKNLVFEFNDVKSYQLNRKESLADVAFENNIPLAELLAMNNISSNATVKPGSFIKISR